MEKRITTIGKCAGIILNKTLLEMSDMAMGDTIDISCSKHKIVIKKKGV